MPQAFSRSLRSLDTEAVGVPRFAHALLVLFSGLWCAWFFGVPVQVAVSSEQARIEAIEASHPVQAPVGGSVLRTAFELGARVREGDVLVELDATAPLQELSKRRAEERALGLERVALDQQLRAVQRAQASGRAATRVHLEQGRILEDEARRLASLGAETLQRKQWLGEEGVLSKLDVLEGIGDAERQQSEVAVRAVANRRVRVDRDVDEAERAELLAELRRQISVLEGHQATTAAAVLVLEQEMGRRRIRAPISGRLGHVLPLTVGSVVQQGETLATLVPEGGLRIVAEFPPARALGRLRSGQAAEMRLDAFPWTAYGSVPAELRHVAQELRAGTLRVELAILGETQGHVSLEHGLTGSVRVEVERTSPAALLWRAAGHALGPREALP